MLFIAVIATIGMSGIVAQVLLLRELLVGFHGNEMTMGIVLAHWLAGEATGAYLAGRSIERVKERQTLFAVLEGLFLVVFPLCLYGARTYQAHLSIPVGEGIGFLTVALLTLAVVTPVGFLHGALFGCACGVRQGNGIGMVYAWETIGTIAGGLLLTYAFLPLVHSFDTALLVLAMNFSAFALYFTGFRARRKILRDLCLLGLLGVVLATGSGAVERIHQRSAQSQYGQGTLLAYRNSVYGNVAVTATLGQLTFFSNGLPVFTSPVGDVSFAEDSGHLPLLAHPRPKDIFIAGGGAGGLLEEILKHPVSSVHYAEVDPLLITMARLFKTPLIQRELSDPRVLMISGDPRSVLKRGKGASYDLIIVGSSHPSDLVSNRLFTAEFFSLARERLREDGILCLRIPGSLSYLSEELGLLNAGILNSLRDSFPFVRVVPGDSNLYLASSSPGLMGVNPQLLDERLRGRGIVTRVISREYLEYRFNPEYLDWFVTNVSIDRTARNRDFRPVTVFHTILLWNKQFRGGMFPVLRFFRAYPPALFIPGMILVWWLPLMFPRHQTRRQRAVSCSIATTGFLGMMANLVLIFCYQIACGYLYHRIGLLLALLMAGTAAGSLWMTRRVNARGGAPGSLLALEGAGIAYACALFLFVTRAGGSASAGVIFGACFFICGALIGLAFPLGGALYLKEGSNPAVTAGSLYFADLLGGWVAGMLAGAAGIALIGVQGTCAVMAFLKAGSCAALFAAYRTKDS